MAGTSATIISGNPATSDNPCVRNCCLDDKNICMGCGRRLAEILEWHHADSDRRANIRLSAQNRIIQRQTLAR